jgi:drug/metabolite transporter (DMT)-like permease
MHGADPHAIAWLGASLLSTALAQLAFKAYFRSRRVAWLAATIALFALVPYTTFRALQGLPLATVYVATTISQLLVVGASLALMGEHYSRRQWAGFGLVLAGVILYNL